MIPFSQLTGNIPGRTRATIPGSAVVAPDFAHRPYWESPWLTQQRAYKQTQMNLQDWAKTQLGLTAAEQAAWNLKKDREAWELKKKQAKKAGELSSKFLGQWSDTINKVGSMYGGTMNFLRKIAGQIGKIDTSTSGAIKFDIKIPGLEGVMDEIKQSYSEWKSQYQPIGQEFLQRSLEQMKKRDEMLGALGRAATPDYAGVAGQAATDVKTQSEMQRQEMARKLLAMGIDPTSGKFGALERKGALQEAKNVAIAMNLARRGEKERATALQAKIAGMYQPGEAARIGAGLVKMGPELLKTQGALGKSMADIAAEAARIRTEQIRAKTAQIGALTNIARTSGQLIGGYAQNVMQPQGEIAGYYLGQTQMF